jgi:hypothetical protein
MIDTIVFGATSSSERHKVVGPLTRRSGTYSQYEDGVYLSVIRRSPAKDGAVNATVFDAQWRLASRG